MAAVHDAPHLVASINLEDARAALGARPRLCANHLGRFHRIGIAGVRDILVLTNTHETLCAGPFGARAALVGCGEKAAAFICGALHDELATRLLARRAVIQAVIIERIVSPALGDDAMHPAAHLLILFYEFIELWLYCIALFSEHLPPMANISQLLLHRLSPLTGNILLF